jgi:hypothetical protein
MLGANVPRARPDEMDFPPIVIAGRSLLVLSAAAPVGAMVLAALRGVFDFAADGRAALAPAFDARVASGSTMENRPGFVARTRADAAVAAHATPACDALDDVTLTCIPSASSTANTSPISTEVLPPSNVDSQGRDTPAAAANLSCDQPSAFRLWRTIAPSVRTFVAIIG